MLGSVESKYRFLPRITGLDLTTGKSVTNRQPLDLEISSDATACSSGASAQPSVLRSSVQRENDAILVLSRKM